MIARLLRLLKLRWRWRSAVTGKWVSREYAEQHKDTTVREKV